MAKKNFCRRIKVNASQKKQVIKVENKNFHRTITVNASAEEAMKKISQVNIRRVLLNKNFYLEL